MYICICTIIYIHILLCYIVQISARYPKNCCFQGHQTSIWSIKMASEKLGSMLRTKIARSRLAQSTCGFAAVPCLRRTHWTPVAIVAVPICGTTCRACGSRCSCEEAPDCQATETEPIDTGTSWRNLKKSKAKSPAFGWFWHVSASHLLDNCLTSPAISSYLQPSL